MQKRHDVIFTGIGGMGVLLTGVLLTRAAASQYRNVLWIPNYTSANRGAPCDCNVIMSDDNIYSPLLDQADTVVVMAASRLKTFEHRTKIGGNLLYETFGLSDEIERKDVKPIQTPIIETAAAVGIRLGANMITLGMYIQISLAVDPVHVETAIKKHFSKKERVCQANLELFRKGLKMPA